MQRRLAFAWSSAFAGVAVSGVIAVAAVTGSPLLGFDSEEAPTGARAIPPTTAGATPDQYVIIHRAAPPQPGERTGVAGTSRRGTVASGAGVAGAGGGAAGAGAGAPPTPSDPTSSSTPETTNAPVATDPTPTTTSPRPPTTTTTPAGLVYRSDLPSGWEVPSGWPADQPLPPIPPGCALGHLEDDLTWNCQH